MNQYVKDSYPPYEEEESNQLVVDYLASMTDAYFLELYRHIFPKGRHEVTYMGYFDE